MINRLPKILPLALIITTISFAQVGVNTTNPTATLHVKGTTSLPGSGSTTTVFAENFASGTINYFTGAGNTCTSGTAIWHIATTDPNIYLNCSNCADNRAAINYNVGCSQNQTLEVGPFSPSQNSIDIHFDYAYRDFDSGDSFTVTLFDETNSSVESTLLNLTSDANDASYAGTVAVVAGDSYSLRFQYIGEYDYGAQVDNIVVEESGTPSPGTYTFRLEDGQEQLGYVLTSDAEGNATWQEATGGSDDQILSISGNQLSIENGNTVTLPGGSGGSYTFENGLNESSGTVRLGGVLTEQTEITLGTRDLRFIGASTGDVKIEGNSRMGMQTNLEDDYVNFGGGFPSVDSDNGLTFTDSGGTVYTRNFLLGYYNGSEGGSTFASGSIEYLTDGLDEILIEASSLNPLDDNGVRLGGSSKRWSAVWSTNGTIQTSDMRLKKNVKPLDYGLEALLRLEPIRYQWKDNSYGNTRVPDSQAAKMLGFSAQQLLEVIPEVVETHSWQAVDENGTFQLKENTNLGVRYAEIIPVIVKAIQEQQTEINRLKTELNTYRRQSRNGNSPSDSGSSRAVIDKEDYEPDPNGW